MSQQVSKEAVEAVTGYIAEAMERPIKSLAPDFARNALQAALAIERPRIEAEFAERLAGELEKRADEAEHVQYKLEREAEEGYEPGYADAEPFRYRKKIYREAASLCRTLATEGEEE